MIHGERDVAVPLATARDAASRGQGTLVTLQKAGHSWLLRDPNALPAILDHLLTAPVGHRIADRIAVDLGLPGVGYIDQASYDDLDAAYLDPDARILALSPPMDVPDTLPRHERPKYRWTIRESLHDTTPVEPLIDDLPDNVTRLPA